MHRIQLKSKGKCRPRAEGIKSHNNLALPISNLTLHRRSVNRRNGYYAPYQSTPEYTYRYRRAASEDRDEGGVTKEETIMRGK